MATDDPIKLTQSLYGDLVRRRRKVQKLANYLYGVHPLAFSSEAFLEAFGGLFHNFADNWCEMVVLAAEERMEPQGFRAIPEEAPDSDAEQVAQIEADDDASRIWEVNDLPEQSSMAHTDALGLGAAYVTIWPGADGKAEITVESAMNALVRSHPKQHMRRTAAIRTWMDEKGYEHAEVFDGADRVYLLRTKTKKIDGLERPERAQWMEEDDPETLDGLSLDASSSMPIPTTRLPMIELLNKPRLTIPKRVGWFAHSELTAIVPIQDAANKTIADLLIGSEFAALPQRTVTKWEADEDDDGNVVEPEFKSGPGKVWWTEADANFDSFEAGDLKQYVEVVTMLVQHIASITSTPPHYLNASADRLSGESLKSAETALVAKVRRRMRNFGTGWEEVIRLAGEVEEIERLANAHRMETIWRDPETRSEAEHMDALSKKKALNVPDPQLWEEAGYSPAQTKRFPAMLAQLQFETEAAGATQPIPEIPALVEG